MSASHVEPSSQLGCPPARSRHSPTGFAELAIAIHAEGTVEETVERILGCALSAVQCAYAGITLVRGKGRIESVATSDPVVAGLDELQNTLGEGPDLDLIAERVSVRIVDMRTETRWPSWVAQVAETGIRSLLGIRLYTDDRIVGALNLYDPAPDHFDIDDEAVAHVMARHAAMALSNAHATANLWHAIDARKRIGQAQGILMERYGLDEEQAFQVLVRYSQHHNVKLRAVAEELVTTRSLPQAGGEKSAGRP